MSTDPIILERRTLVGLTWRGRTGEPVHEHIDGSPTFVVHRAGRTLELGPSYELARESAARQARDWGCEFIDLIAESAPFPDSASPWFTEQPSAPPLSFVQTLRAVPSAAARLREPLARAAEAARQLFGPHPRQASEPGPLLRLLQRDAGD
ncbi:hypothetical protein [Ancylobacter terrae]|uniref:hypothetical protein n=1 Tax=Ancylobacter sp. sgz301288 TaxID=3342077 RepID=UPI0038595B83